MIQTLHLAALDLLIALPMQMNSTPFMAQSSGGLDSMLAKGLGIISKIFFILGVVAIANGGLKMDKDREAAKTSIVGGIICAAAGLIMEAFFGAAGLQGSVIKVG